MNGPLAAVSCKAFAGLDPRLIDGMVLLVLSFLSMSSLLPERDTACPHCDLLARVPALQQGERASCPRCGAELAKRCRGDWQRVGALALAACISLAMALSGLFMELRSAGGDQSSTLIGFPISLALERPLLAGIVAFFCIGAPAGQAVGLLALATAFLLGAQSARWTWIVRSVKWLQPWSMADVFVVGILVSLIKILSLAQVGYGLSFWAFIGFSLCLAGAYASFDAKGAVAELEGAER
ncbi:paraquat-inducible protein A [Pelagicoccus sp. SDUM812003]|uniref:paraquat-inducible protein A n=1 Tax=Pelagicoccus sp. SDUM812003 TaxID=3041267 RepID=UPI00280F5D96|nr:paraquat-inducible protein A [Pelagicoccus sp. SDUM812003]MDQ8201762.1 paraquat-inducible protein A [Pelagicoccus sp. SDUM812003]